MLSKIDNMGRGVKWVIKQLNPKSISSSQLFDSQEYSWPEKENTSIDTIIGNKDYLNTIQVLLFIERLVSYSMPVSALTKISKFDSPKNAPSTLIDAIKNVLNIVRFENNLGAYSQMYINFPTVKLFDPYDENTGEFKIDKNHVRDFVRSNTAQINQSAFTIGYDIPLALISEYIFTQNNRNV